MIAPPVSTPRLKRTDPELLAVVDLTATAGHGALVKPSFRAERNQGDQEADDFFQEEDDPMDELELDPKKFRRIPQGLNQLMGRQEGGMRRSSDSGKGVYFVSVTGLVPYREQLKIYQSSFLNASAFDPSRDAPRYISWKLERSPVVPGSDKRKWTPITLGMAQKRAKEIGTSGMGMGNRDMSMDPRARDSVLTSMNPPLIARDMDELSRHEGIMTMEEAMAEMKAQAEAEADAKQPDADTGDEDPDALDVDPQHHPGRRHARRRNGVRRRDDGR